MFCFCFRSRKKKDEIRREGPVIDGDLEEIREVAQAYYERLSEKEMKSAKKLFQSIDKNKDDKITLEEYTKYVKKAKLTDMNHPEFFDKLDQNGDQTLDFQEFVTLFYMCKSGRTTCCKTCGVYLKGAYFSCARCFFKRDGHDRFDLCCSCYRDGKFEHHKDAVFLDNYTLLRQTRSAADENKMEEMIMKTIIKTVVEDLCNIQ